jgi:LysM repeat protein
MSGWRSDRGQVRIRRRGRHSTPSQVERVAQQAGKAAPAVAIAGALVAAPHAQPAFAATAQPPAATAAGHQGQAADAGPGTAAKLDSFQTRTVTIAAAKPARHAAAAKSTTYRVRSGDSLSKIASRYYRNAAAWQFLYHENEKKISDPNLIYVDESLAVPASAPAHYTLTQYVPKHAKAAPAPTVRRAVSTKTVGSRSGSGRSDSGRSAATGGSAGRGTVIVQSASRGSYSCSALEQEWEAAGGSAAHAFMAAEIAMAESGGNPNAISPTDDFGLWQINGSNGALATLNAFQNAKSAIILSDDGTNWGAWTTYHSGAYYGRC